MSTKRRAALVRATPTLLRTAYNLLSQTVLQQVIGTGFRDLRPAHGNAMEPIAIEDGLRMTDLAKRAGIAPQSMGELVDDLVSRGYLERREDPEDRRAKRIHLTPKGQANVAASRDAVAQVEGDLEELLGKRPYQQLRRTLEKVIRYGGHLPRSAGDGEAFPR